MGRFFQYLTAHRDAVHQLKMLQIVHSAGDEDTTTALPIPMIGPSSILRAVQRKAMTATQDNVVVRRKYVYNSDKDHHLVLPFFDYDGNTTQMHFNSYSYYKYKSNYGFPTYGSSYPTAALDAEEDALVVTNAPEAAAVERLVLDTLDDLATLDETVVEWVERLLVAMEVEWVDELFVPTEVDEVICDEETVVAVEVEWVDELFVPTEVDEVICDEETVVAVEMGWLDELFVPTEVDEVICDEETVVAVEVGWLDELFVPTEVDEVICDEETVVTVEVGWVDVELLLLHSKEDLDFGLGHSIVAFTGGGKCKEVELHGVHSPDSVGFGPSPLVVMGSMVCAVTKAAETSNTSANFMMVDGMSSLPRQPTIDISYVGPTNGRLQFPIHRSAGNGIVDTLTTKQPSTSVRFWAKRPKVHFTDGH
ncbi:uncharacterized protein BT62DRAFT_1079053 [Guyanagaster necrorhizus]|uniref:Uncharacterized protein n=1 Tax=Guyanagaster necrorhizus TaxID=856835 RepID=A0A9P7VLC2_9AGAR|nr:uncharacterized protein BT62DRAFT_1079053 [Guyanagaster necrorhizus MCA 3950]KAG7442673.1 hypothetical protein BT62DRAFT_1079053 [Guyanagaster necrorhizus MCA 3950]